MRHTLTPLAALILIAIPLAAIAAGADEALDLRLRLEKGDTYQFTTTTEQLINRWVNDAESNETITLVLTQTVKVLSVKDDGTATLRVTYDRVAFKCESDAGTFEFDSDNPPEQPQFPANLFGALVGQSLDVKVSPTGKVTSVKNGLEVHMAVIGALHGEEDSEEQGDEDGHTTRHVTRIVFQGGDAAAGLTPMNEGLRLLNSQETLKEHLAFLAVLYPDAPVKTNETWNTTGKRTGKYGGTYETAYKLVSRADGAAQIEFAGTIKGDPDAKPLRMGVTFGPTAAMTELEGTEKGTLTVDESTGLVRQGTLSSTLKGNTSAFDPAVDQKNMIETPTAVDTKITIKGGRLVQTLEKGAPDSGE